VRRSFKKFNPGFLKETGEDGNIGGESSAWKIGEV
jgi:hypothetical protein